MKAAQLDREVSTLQKTAKNFKDAARAQEKMINRLETDNKALTEKLAASPVVVGAPAIDNSEVVELQASLKESQARAVQLEKDWLHIKKILAGHQAKKIATLKEQAQQTTHLESDNKSTAVRAAALHSQLQKTSKTPTRRSPSWRRRRPRRGPDLTKTPSIACKSFYKKGTRTPYSVFGFCKRQTRRSPPWRRGRPACKGLCKEEKIVSTSCRKNCF